MFDCFFVELYFQIAKVVFKLINTFKKGGFDMNDYKITLSLIFFFVSTNINLIASIYMKKSKLPPSIQKDFETLMVNRVGILPDSSMITHGFQSFVLPKEKYLISPKGLVSIGRTNIQRKGKKTKLEITEPKHIDMRATWLSKDHFRDDQANILGKSGKLIVYEQKIKIPIAKTTIENLRYYNSKLLQLGDTISFEASKPLPVANMTIGHNYVKGYLLQKKFGGGAYLESHNNPHFHMPQNKKARGHLILGKKVDDKYRLSAFEIPFGFAIYTGPYVIHTDSFLIGKYTVIYSTSSNYSTVILQDQEQNLIPIEII